MKSSAFAILLAIQEVLVWFLISIFCVHVHVHLPFNYFKKTLVYTLKTTGNELLSGEILKKRCKWFGYPFLYSSFIQFREDKIVLNRANGLCFTEGFTEDFLVVCSSSSKCVHLVNFQCQSTVMCDEVRTVCWVFEQCTDLRGPTQYSLSTWICDWPLYIFLAYLS